MRAVVYALSADDERRCVEHCLSCGYDIVAVVRDNEEGTRWTEAWRVAEEADRLVIVSRSRLPKNRRPQLEAVDEQPCPGRRVIPRLRRPRVADY